MSSPHTTKEILKERRVGLPPFQRWLMVHGCHNLHAGKTFSIIWFMEVISMVMGCGWLTEGDARHSNLLIGWGKVHIKGVDGDYTKQLMTANNFCNAGLKRAQRLIRMLL